MRKPLTWMRGKFVKLKCLERILFFLLEMHHLLVFSVHTSQSVLAYPPPPIQCWFGLWSARPTTPNIEWGGGNVPSKR